MKLSLPRAAARPSLGVSPIPSSRFPATGYQHRSLRPISHATASTPFKPTTRDANDEYTYTSSPNDSQLASTQSTRTQIPPTTSISEKVRLLMRQVPYPVAIITATDPTGPANTTSFRGMTVSSFNTVTLHPEPVISFNVRRPSETLNALAESGRFLVHLLSSSPATATLARDFSKGNTTLASILNGHGDFEFSSFNTSGDGHTHRHSKQPLPLLRRRLSDASRPSLDFPFVFECKLHREMIDVHDHSIVLGTVVRTIQADDAMPIQQGAAKAEHDPSSEHLCLTYANTKFWNMGREI
ncbi:hypothetical protein PDE_08625 [Penicillium oxalicum 114-2]|uniref:Flavin reductase like domain-containing protein n=1 Tax=Penicillium oxalicum (strain 114-2 / CGMCC 5302) TaxID=933388 RepID=S8B492_PENO1|nr:hypothetical protein PDE_08625 [Penicillium oxalicum 114-2]